LADDASIVDSMITKFEDIAFSSTILVKPLSVSDLSSLKSLLFILSVLSLLKLVLHKKLFRLLSFMLDVI